jgi:hypothetical protein
MCQSSPSIPSSTTSVAELPDWAKDYAKDTLAKGAALTDINKNPYQKFGGERVAGFQPLQEQSFKTVAGLDAGPEGFSKGISSYMSPYMQNVVDIEKREAGRQSAIAGTQQQAQATQAGAFGGGRDAIMRAERERNLAQQMGDIQSKGSQAAFEQAANQFRQGVTQQSGLAGQQAALGQVQQQQAQRPMDIAYQDFLNQQNYPYKQIGFMSDLIRGLPLGQKSTQQTYEAPGSLLGQLGGLGMGAYGLSKMGAFAEGGLTYADGGVTDPNNIESILAKLSDAQLQQAKKSALDRRDINEAQMIDAEIAKRANMRQSIPPNMGGIAPAVTDQFANDMEQNMATGGIVAFADRGVVTSGDDYSHEGMRTSDSISVPKTKAKSAAGVPDNIKPAVTALSQQTGQPEEDIMARVPGLMDMFQKQYAPLIEQQRAMVEQSKPDTQAMKEQGLAQALTQFGFKMAANAARPGARFLESASGAAPEISNAVMDMNKLMSAKQDNYNKMKMEQAKYENALQIGNMKDATVLAGQIRQSQQTDKQIRMQQDQLAEQIRAHDINARQTDRQLNIMQQQANTAAARQPENVVGLAKQLMQDPTFKGTMNDAIAQAAHMLKGGIPAEIRADAALAARRATAVEKAQASPAGSLLAMTPKSDPRYAERKAAFDEQVQRELDQLPTPDAGISSAAPASAAPTISPSAFKIEKIGK